MKKIIELRQIANTLSLTNEKDIWKVVLMVRYGNDYVQETWTRECVTFEERALWSALYEFIPQNRTNYKELHRVFTKYDFEVEKKNCKIYPTYWEQDPPMDKYLVYAGKIVEK